MAKWMDIMLLRQLWADGVVDPNINNIFGPVFLILKLLQQAIKLSLLIPEYILSEGILKEEPFMVLQPFIPFLISYLLFHPFLVRRSLQMRFEHQGVIQIKHIGVFQVLYLLLGV